MCVVAGVQKRLELAVRHPERRRVFVSFVTAGLYGDASLQIVFIAISIYGWLYWLRGGEAHHEAPITRLPWQGHIATLAFVALATWALASVLQTWLHSTVPLWDGLTTSLSLGAIFLQSRKYLDNWYYWIVADVIYVPLYVAKGLPLTGLLYVIFIPMCLAGIITWNRTLTTRTALAT